MQKTKSYRSVWAVGSASFFALTGCSFMETPQQACVAPKTIEGISQLLTEGLGQNYLALATLQNANFELDSLPQTVASLWKSQTISINEVTLSEVNKDTKVVQCSGVLKMNLPQTNTGNGNGVIMASEFPIVYERQPQANGDQYVYRVVSVGDYQPLMAHLAASSQKHAQSPVAAPAPHEEPKAASMDSPVESGVSDIKHDSEEGWRSNPTVLSDLISGETGVTVENGDNPLPFDFAVYAKSLVANGYRASSYDRADNDDEKVSFDDSSERSSMKFYFQHFNYTNTSHVAAVDSAGLRISGPDLIKFLQGTGHLKSGGADQSSAN